jgi:predicted nucleotidyltransferase component of viral defense system
VTAAPRDLPRSVLARLRARSIATREDVSFLQRRYAAERFLYRLGASHHREGLVLKGAMLFAIWGGPAYRPTRDLDFTGYGASDVESVLGRIRDVCSVTVPDDGLVFDMSTLANEPIREDDGYGGVRVTFIGKMGSTRIPMQLDIGFGNAIQPPATVVEYPALLEFPAPRIRAYPQEAVVAEKLNAMVVNGERNSRYKDFYDLHALSSQFGFDGRQLAESISATFERRRTPIGGVRPAALATPFYADGARGDQWRAYVRSRKLPGAPESFDLVGERLLAFLAPVWDGLVAGDRLVARWRAGGPWSEGEGEGA